MPLIERELQLTCETTPKPENASVGYGAAGGRQRSLLKNRYGNT